MSDLATCEKGKQAEGEEDTAGEVPEFEAVTGVGGVVGRGMMGWVNASIV